MGEMITVEDDFGSGYHTQSNVFEPFDSDLAYYGLINQEDEEIIIDDGDESYRDGGVHHLRDIYVRTAGGQHVAPLRLF